jgi:hypothetical protein
MATQNHSGSGHNIQAARDVFIETIPKLTSDLTTIVNILGRRLFMADGVPDKDVTAFNPNDKIQYNNVVKFRLILENYKMYVGKLTTIYGEFDGQGTNITRTVLENIRLAYLKEKAGQISRNAGKEEIAIIREFADAIIEGVESALLNQIRTSSNIETTSDTINISLQIILIDAFIRCKILEEPPNAVA